MEGGLVLDAAGLEVEIDAPGIEGSDKGLAAHRGLGSGRHSGGRVESCLSLVVGGLVEGLTGWLGSS